jgi:hypothetical protein
MSSLIIHQVLSSSDYTIFSSIQSPRYALPRISDALLRSLHLIDSSTHMDECRPPVGRSTALPQLCDGIVECVRNRVKRDNLFGEYSFIKQLSYSRTVSVVHCPTIDELEGYLGWEVKRGLTTWWQSRFEIRRTASPQQDESSGQAVSRLLSLSRKH